MIIDQATVKPLTQWLTDNLQPITEAEPDILASYVLALIKDDKETEELQQRCIAQLEDILKEEAAPFVEKLFKVLADKSFEQTEEGDNFGNNHDNKANDKMQGNSSSQSRGRDRSQSRSRSRSHSRSRSRSSSTGSGTDNRRGSKRSRDSSGDERSHKRRRNSEDRERGRSRYDDDRESSKYSSRDRDRDSERSSRHYGSRHHSDSSSRDHHSRSSSSSRYKPHGHSSRDYKHKSSRDDHHGSDDKPDEDKSKQHNVMDNLNHDPSAEDTKSDSIPGVGTGRDFSFVENINVPPYRGRGRGGRGGRGARGGRGGQSFRPNPYAVPGPYNQNADHPYHASNIQTFSQHFAGNMPHFLDENGQPASKKPRLNELNQAGVEPYNPEEPLLDFPRIHLHMPGMAPNIGMGNRNPTHMGHNTTHPITGQKITVGLPVNANNNSNMGHRIILDAGLHMPGGLGMPGMPSNPPFFHNNMQQSLMGQQETDSITLVGGDTLRKSTKYPNNNNNYQHNQNNYQHNNNGGKPLFGSNTDFGKSNDSNELHKDSFGGFDKGRPSNTLAVVNIPPGLNTIDQLNSHFKRYGTIVNIQIKNDASKAFVQFSSSAEAEAAFKSPEAVLGNRFIRVHWAKRQHDIPSTSSKTTPAKDVHNGMTFPKNTLVNKEMAEVQPKQPDRENIKQLLGLLKTKSGLLTKQIDQHKGLLEKMNQSKTVNNKDKMEVINKIESLTNSLKENLLQQKKLLTSSAVLAKQPAKPLPHVQPQSQPTAVPKLREEIVKERLDRELDIISHKPQTGPSTVQPSSNNSSLPSTSSAANNTANATTIAQTTASPVDKEGENAITSLDIPETTDLNSMPNTVEKQPSTSSVSKEATELNQAHATTKTPESGHTNIAASIPTGSTIPVSSIPTSSMYFPTSRRTRGGNKGPSVGVVVAGGRAPFPNVTVGGRPPSRYPAPTHHMLQQQAYIQQNRMALDNRTTTIRIQNLPDNARTEESVRGLYQPFGEITSVVFPEPSEALLKFKTRQAATMASTKGKFIDGKPVFISWHYDAKPPQTVPRIQIGEATTTAPSTITSQSPDTDLNSVNTPGTDDLHAGEFGLAAGVEEEIDRYGEEDLLDKYQDDEEEDDYDKEQSWKR